MVASNCCDSMQQQEQHPEYGSSSSCSEGEEEISMKARTSSTTNIFTSSISTEKHETNNSANEERRFVWFQKEEEQKLRDATTTKQEYEYHPNAIPVSSKVDSKKDFKDKVRAGGGAKGKTGSTDFTRGKNAFVRPCTVGWKSQNQPLQRGGGPRTPRQKG